MDVLEHLRAIRATLRTRERLSHHGDGRRAIRCAAPAGAQDLLTNADPETFFRPPYVGHRGRLDVYATVAR